MRYASGPTYKRRGEGTQRIGPTYKGREGRREGTKTEEREFPKVRVSRIKHC